MVSHFLLSNDCMCVRERERERERDCIFITAIVLARDIQY